MVSEFYGSHFGLPPSSVHGMTGLGGNFVWTTTCRTMGPCALRHGIQNSMEAIFGLPPSDIHKMTGWLAILYKQWRIIKLLSFSIRQMWTDSWIRRKKHSAAPPGIELGSSDCLEWSRQERISIWTMPYAHRPCLLVPNITEAHCSQCRLLSLTIESAALGSETSKRSAQTQSSQPEKNFSLLSCVRVKHTVSSG